MGEEGSPGGPSRLRRTDRFHKRKKRLFGRGFALTWLIVAYKRRELNDRRWATPTSERNTWSGLVWRLRQAPPSTNAAQTLSIIA